MNKKNKRLLGLILLILLVAVGSSQISAWLPTIGDHSAPAHQDVSSYYIINAPGQTHSPNLVTAVLADYRAFDTLFETCVLFLSGTATLIILSSKEKVRKDNRTMKEIANKSEFGGRILDASFRIIVPMVMLYGLYVLFHGEVSLGGGFQAGALIASAHLLERLIPSFYTRIGNINEETAVIVAGIGAAIYAVTGMLSVFNGGNFLEYGMFPFGHEGAGHLHSIGIFMVECGVTVCVAAVIIDIFESVLERTNFDD